MRRPWVVFVVLVFALTLPFTFTAGAQGDIEQSLAKSLAWMLDHNSGVGYRVADHQWRGTEKFAQRLPNGYSPAQIRHAYGFDEVFTEGDGQIIGIVMFNYYPTAAADLKQFIRTFRLRSMYGLPGGGTCSVAYGPHPCFQVVYAQGSQPAVDASADFEQAIDIEWAHAIAPGADILLVETATNAFADMLGGVDRAVNDGASVVSMSWGVPEGAPEAVLDHHFNVTGVTFVASAGDTGNATVYPAVSPYVLSVGGTKLQLRGGERIAPETAWSNSGGGISAFEPEPTYQSHFPIPNSGGFRGNPDVAYDADPTTG
ncbi:MAG TPA: S8 family serine peptidase, partial [Vicinamibacterales bacterium]|nr:S8 family serine peptidase [Vicinamibacterales bacterium]